MIVWAIADGQSLRPIVLELVSTRLRYPYPIDFLPCTVANRVLLDGSLGLTPCQSTNQSIRSLPSPDDERWVGCKIIITTVLFLVTDR